MYFFLIDFEYFFGFDLISFFIDSDWLWDWIGLLRKFLVI